MSWTRNLKDTVDPKSIYVFFMETHFLDEDIFHVQIIWIMACLERVHPLEEQ